MDKRKKIFYIIGAIGLAFLITGIILVVSKKTEMPYFVFSVISLVLAGLTFSLAGIFRPEKENKK